MNDGQRKQDGTPASASNTRHTDQWEDKRRDGKAKSVNSSSQRKLDDTTEQDVQHLLEETIITIGMSTEQILIKCPAKPITHTFLQFIDNDERETGQGR